MKTLKLSIVLGGGASLGGFSASALCQSLKQLLVYGQYKNKAGEYQAYERIEIDSLSGASAGALALGILLRVLSDYRSLYRPMQFAHSRAWEEHLQKQIEQEFGLEALATLSADKRDSLLAVQALQEVQERLWIEEIGLDRLTGSGSYYKDLSKEPSFCDRSVLDSLASKYFRLSPLHQLDQGLGIKPCPLLGERLLFACTLSNLDYTLDLPEAAPQLLLGGSRWLKALNDSIIGKGHKELRVFDLHFRELDTKDRPYLPSNWIQYQVGNDWRDEVEGKEKWIRDLRSEAAWRELAATCIASAAFPLVFKPVALRRYAYEFGKKWPQELQSKESHVFSYIDGGVFNNEPIKELTRLSNYLDSLPKPQESQRLLLFVDPHVGDLDGKSLQRLSSGQYSLSHSLLSGQAYLSQKGSLWHLAEQVPRLLSALLNEARSLETAKIFSVLKHFESRKELRLIIKESISQLPEKEQFLRIRTAILEDLQRLRKEMHLPEGSLEIVKELLRIVDSEAEFFAQQGLPLDNKAALSSLLAAFSYTEAALKLPEALPCFLALAMLAQDIQTGLVGKNRELALLPIAPFDFYKQALDKEALPSLMALPGSLLAGFGGFASVELRKYEMQYARFCASKILSAEGFLASSGKELLPPPPFRFEEHRQLIESKLFTALSKRIKELLPEQYSLLKPFIESFLEEKLQTWLGKELRKDTGQGDFSARFEIRIPSQIFSLRYRNTQGRTQALEPIKIGGDYGFSIELQYSSAQGRWLGSYTDEQQLLHIDRSRLFGEEPALSIALPQNPNPNIRQYSAKLYGQLSVQGLVQELPANTWEEEKTEGEKSLDSSLF